MSDMDPLQERLWERGWEGHSLAQRRRLARLRLAEKLEWLESAHRLVLQLGRSRSRVSSGQGQKPPSSDPTGTQDHRPA